MGYRRRVVDDELDELMGSLAAVALEGPKAVGKTETALQRAATVHRLDDPGQEALIRADPSRIVAGRPPVLVDEWQRVPQTWDVVRRAVDEDPSPGRFLLTGSASPTDRPAHSGAGRIVPVRLRPLSLAERGVATPTVSCRDLLGGGRAALVGTSDVGLEQYAAEIVGSGFPGLRNLGGRALRAQLDGYVDRIVERDFEELGHPVRRPSALRRWLAAYAAATSTTASYEKIRDAATSGEGDKPAKTTTIPYRDVLERLWVIDAIPAWLPTRNHLSRLSAPPKHHLADPALAARILGVGVGALLDAHPAGLSAGRDTTLLGQLFESLVALDVRAYAQSAEATVRHLRTWAGEHEIDLIVVRDDDRVVAVEVKLGQTVDDRDVRHLKWLAGEIGGDLLDAIVVTSGPYAYRRPDGIGVVPATLLGP